eukprot:m.90151 g.90151  ORF g.90151 m.90151 type:complete len:256 (-) comp12301_c5_seq1:61-828(-)
MSEKTHLLPHVRGGCVQNVEVKAVEWKLFHKGVAEFFGTMLFVFVGCSVVQSAYVEDEKQFPLTSSFLMIALGHGLAIFAIVSATAKISGGHLNPAVSFAIFICDKSFKVLDLIVYWVAEFTGAIVGAAMLKGVYPAKVLDQTHYGCHNLGDEFTEANGVFVEIILTLILVLVILRTAVDRVGMDFAPLAIGITVTIDIFVGVPVTGASMNPARSLGPAVISDFWRFHWIFWVGPFSGAIVAALIYRFFMRTPRL